MNINFGKNLAPSRTKIHNTKEDEEATNPAKMKLKMRSPKTWPPSSWYQDEDGHSTQWAESQKSEETVSLETLGDKDHEGVINFYIEDYRPTNNGSKGGEALGGKRIEQTRRRRLHIVRKSENSVEVDQQKTKKLAPASQSTDISCKATDLKKNTQQPQATSDTSDHPTEVANGE